MCDAAGTGGELTLNFYRIYVGIEHPVPHVCPKGPGKLDRNGALNRVLEFPFLHVCRSLCDEAG